MSDYFISHEHESHPELPEHLWPRGVEAILPNTPYYPTEYSVLRTDIASHKIYLNATSELDGEATNPEYFHGRFSLMRVLASKDNEMLDGFLIDIRHIPNGNIRSENIENMPDYLVDVRRYIPVAGISFIDQEQHPAYVGDLRLLDYAADLAHITDEIRNKDKTSTITPGQQAVKHEVEIQNTLPIPDNFKVKDATAQTQKSRRLWRKKQ